ncbi:MAG: T9SS C-terminal target domain-containing protein [Sphingobacteriia bacterium]|nr:T9SS C-terminal target domain-containing protein [Sphingobacteriia bacterium]
MKVSNTLINQWEELSFNFAGVLSAPSSIGIDQLIVFPDFKLNPGRTSSNICYFDNITFNAAGSTSTVTGTTTSLKGLTGNQQAETKLFPNPNNGEFSLQLSGTEEAEIRIFSVLGLRIKTIKAESMNTIDMHQFANGLYVLQVWEKDQLVYKTQLSKE